jgi:hypothetical protein
MIFHVQSGSLCIVRNSFQIFHEWNRKRRYILFAFSSACLSALSFSLKILAAASPSRRRLIPPNYLLYERASKITMTTQSLFWHRDFPLFLSFFEMVLLLLLLTYLSNLPRAILISSQRQDISLIWSAVRFDSHFSKTVLQVSEAL